MSEQVFFAEVSAHRAKADLLFAGLKDLLLELVPTAFIEHVGSTSLPDGLTKGDLDVQVRVDATHYEDACRALAAAFEFNPGGFTDHGRSFKDDATDPPLGVHLTIIDSCSDIQHRQRDLLSSRPDLRAEYDALKREFDGGDMDAYRDAKDAFFSRLAAQWDDVELVDYDARWPAMFADEARRLRTALASERVVDVQHFGSTAVAGLASKPIIDVLVVVPSLDAAPSITRCLATLEYVFWEDNPKTDRLFFVKGMPPRGVRRTHHVHVSEPSGELVERLLFRDYLREHPTESERYAALKRDLAAKHRFDREAYTRAKTDDVAAIMEKARSARHSISR